MRLPSADELEQLEDIGKFSRVFGGKNYSIF